MKLINRLWLLFFLVCNAVGVYSQSGSEKQALQIKNLKDFNQWPTLAPDRNISADGGYVYYTVENEKPGINKLHINSTNSNWQKTFDNATSPAFSESGKLAFARLPNEQLLILPLGKDKNNVIKKVKEYKLVGNKNGEWLMYLLNDNKLIIRDIATNKEREYAVTRYFISPDNSMIVLLDGTQENAKISVVSFKSDNMFGFTVKGIVNNVVFEDKSRKIALSIDSKNGAGGLQRSFWIYTVGQAHPVKILDNQSEGLKSKYVLNYIKEFAADGASLVFDYTNIPVGAQTKKTAASVDVYNYLDNVAYTIQKDVSGYSAANNLFTGIINIDKGTIVYKQGDEYFNIPSRNNNSIGVVSSSSYGRKNAGSRKYSLISTLDGKIVPLKYPVALNNSVSPDGKYVILKSELPSTINLFSYEIRTGIIHDLTGALPIPDKDTEFPSIYVQRKFKLSAWVKGENKVWINDNYDIWEIDVSGGEKPVNITNGFGRKNRILFNLSTLNYTSGVRDMTIDKQRKGKRIILASYNYNTVDNSYYSINLNSISNPKKLNEGPYLYETVDINGNSLQGGWNNCKASKSDTYLILRQNASESCNLFITKDFKSFKPISDVHPEKKFNWLTSELTTFTSLDGRSLKGVLYKPENFDPKKKYPIIFYFYDQMSNDLHQYKEPQLSGAVIDIPYYASNGYLIYTPDLEIRYGKGEAGEYALNGVLGAAKSLEKFPWVDTSKMAIHGHSWGGFECNYIVTHTNRFAAAVTGAGHSDMIGGFGLPTHGGNPAIKQVTYDYMGAPPYVSPYPYIKNSPKLFADKVTTPLLIMHNEKDDAVLFHQGLSFFFTLWNLNKKVWLLQYDGEGHVIQNEDNEVDYTIRLKQFFDHYLKGAPAPVWMTRGLPFAKKGLEDGLEYDDEIKTPAQP